MKKEIKSTIVDKYLYRIRAQIVSLIDPDSTVIEFGCGNGDLLFKLADKIKSGIGIDTSSVLIEFANKKKNEKNINNIQFREEDVCKIDISKIYTDYSIASLLYHILSIKEAQKLLQKQVIVSDVVIICGFSEPENWKQRFLLWLDQRFTKHYGNFRRYKDNGYLDGLVNSIKNIEYDVYDTFDPVIKIYKIYRSKMV